MVESTFGAMVVGVTGAKSVLDVRCSDGETASSATDHSGVREIMAFTTRAPWPAQELLHALKLFERDHGRVFSRVGLAFPFDHAGIEKIREYLVDRAQGWRRATDALALDGSQFFDCMKLHQHGYRKVVALMGSFMSAKQEELLKKHRSSWSHVILLLDEDEAGQEAREKITARLATFAFVKVHVFDKADTQPEHLSAEELQQILGGAS
jgi:5S rRNA maturation endonuclease (ribonuclease M5)